MICFRIHNNTDRKKIKEIQWNRILSYRNFHIRLEIEHFIIDYIVFVLYLKLCLVTALILFDSTIVKFNISIGVMPNLTLRDAELSNITKWQIRQQSDAIAKFSTSKFTVWGELTLNIDISWVDWAYRSSTCDVMYCRQRRHLYYGGQI
jgi:hypothetical protein